MKKILMLLTLVLAVVGLAACGVQEDGVTDTSIKVGNTAATSGAFAGVGVPFNQGLQAYFHMINEQGGIAGRKIEFVTYDDEFDATKGLNYTKQLVEEDKIFALVGHFGTPTVGATLEYIQEVNIPMVYAATGINGLYFEKSVENPIFAVQPIYLTDGRLMTSRLLNESVFDGSKIASNAKIGVLHTTTDDGVSIKAGVEAEIKWAKENDGFTGEAIYKSFSATDVSAAVLELQNAGVSAVIIASNQAPFKAAVGAMQTANLNVPVFTSYVNSDATSVDPAVEYTFDIYANAWVDMFKTSDDEYSTLAGFIKAIDAYDPTLGGAAMPGVAYAIAGYIAAKIFVDGLKQVGDGELTRETYIKALEAAGTLDIPMGGTVSFAGGQRWGIDSMSLLKLTRVPATAEKDASWAWITDKPIETLAKIQAK